MRELASALLVIRTVSLLSIRWALKYMTLVTISTLGTVAKVCKSSANAGRGRVNVDVNIAACTVCAVAAEEECAGWHAVVSLVVRHVTGVFR